MKLLVAVEQHFRRGPDQHICADGPVTYASWASYLETFEHVVILGRMGSADSPRSAEAADGRSVWFHGLPDYYGPWQYLRNLPQLVRRVRRSVEECDAYILRVPGLVGRLAWKEIRRVGRRYAVEVLGDPWDAMGPQSVRTIFRPVFRRAGVQGLKTMCQGAMAVHYVTQKFLQNRYPPSSDCYAVGFPDALTNFEFASSAALDARFRRIDDANESGRPVRIGFLGSLSQLYKGLDVLLRAASLCGRRGLKVEVLIAGDGRYADRMKSLARKLGIEGQTKFLGQLPSGRHISDLLDSIGLFVMPSYAEGLPRVLLEAMARGCPCIGTNVGGIPELLEPDDMVPPGDSAALAQKIMEVAGNGSRMKAMAQGNFAKASQFSPELLTDARRDFCRYVRLHSITS